LTSPCLYQLHPAVAIESFGERALALHCVDLRLVELNATARDLLARLDGETTLQEVAAAMAADYDQPPADVWFDVQESISQMVDLGLVEQISPGERPASPDNVPVT